MHSDSRVIFQIHWSCEVISWMRIDWLDLPKLTTLSTNGKYSSTFCYPRHITLESDSHPLRMMFRHTQSQQCGSSTCIPVQEWRHNPRKYSLHPSLTNRHWGSCKSSSIEIEARDPSLCHTLTTPPSHPPQSSFSGIRGSVIAVRTRK